MTKKFVRPTESLSGLTGKGRRSATPTPGSTVKLSKVVQAEVVKIRRTYIEERSSFDSMLRNAAVRYEPPKHYEGKPARWLDGEVEIVKAVPSIWVTLAKTFAEKSIDPSLFIPSIFSYIELGSPAPEPPQLVSKRNLQKWPKIRESQSELIRYALHYQLRLARGKITTRQVLGNATPERAYEIVLLDEGLALSALLRYCLALAFGSKSLRQIAQRYEAQACLQFDRYREFYLYHWKGILPPKFEVRMKWVHAYLHAEDEDYEIQEEEVQE